MPFYSDHVKNDNQNFMDDMVALIVMMILLLYINK